MSDYLYVWNDPERKMLVVSGLEFSCFANLLGKTGGVLLLDHQSQVGLNDSVSGFDFVPCTDISDLVAENIYSWGNFVWVDYLTREPRPFPPPALSPDAVAELLYFTHTAKPLRDVAIPGLNNRFLAYIHDDGWYLRLYYADWQDIEALLTSLVPFNVEGIDMRQLKNGVIAYWIENGLAEEEEITQDIDSILNRRDWHKK